MSNLNSMEQACIKCSLTIDAAIMRLNRRQYEDDMKQVAYWRAIAINRASQGLSIDFPLRRARYYLAQAKHERHKIDKKFSKLS
jgi:hypothetical protein